MPNTQNESQAGGHIVSTQVFLVVWGILLMLTGLTVWVASLHLGELSTVTSLLIASLKGLLVIFFFMHLKYEPPVYKIMALLSVLTLTVIILLTFTDVWYR